MNLDERLKKAQRLEKIPTYYLSEYIWRVLIIQKLILIPLAKTSITPNQVTAMGGIFVILSFLSLYLGHNVIAGFCYLAYSILDHTDGILARYKNLKSKLGSWMDSITDYIAWNGIFIFAYFIYDTSMFSLIFVLLSMNIYVQSGKRIFQKKLATLKTIHRFGIKKWFLERGFILGIDASLLAILISVMLFTAKVEFFCYLIGGIYIFEFIHRSIELYINIRLEKKD